MRQALASFVALFRAFFARFFESELTATPADARFAFFSLIAIFTIPGVVWPILMAGASPPSNDPATWGWWMVARVGGVDALRQMAVADKTLYLGYAMALAALLASFNWQRLMPDRRDAIVLSAFPVRPAAIIAARVAALLAYLLTFAIGVHTLPAIAFGSLLAVGNTWVFAARGIAGHLIASVVASLSVVLTVVALQAIAIAALGPRWFARWSSALHAGIVAASIGAVMFLPPASGRIFLGLYEALVGPPSAAIRPLLVIDPWPGLLWPALSMTMALLCYPLVYRRVLTYSLERPDERRRSRRLGAWMSAAVARLVSRDPAGRGVAEFYLTMLARGPQQRLAMTIGIGAAAAWGVPVWRAFGGAAAASPPAAVLAWPISAIAFVLIAMRAAALLPAERPASWLFDLMPPDPRGTRSMLARTMIAVGVVPVAVISAIAIGRVWGAEIAIGHLAVAVGIGAMLTELLLWNSMALPCRNPWSVDAAHLRIWWPAYLIGFLWCTIAVPTIESFAVRRIEAAALFAAYGFGVAAVVRAFVRRARPAVATTTTDLDVIGSALRAGSGAAGDDSPAASRRHASFGLAGLETYGATRGDERWYDGLSLWPREVGRDARLALRRLRRTPVFPAFAVATLAVGIGTTTAAHHLIRKVVGAEASVAAPDRVKFIGGSAGRALSWPDFEDLQRVQTAFTAVDGWETLPSSISARGTVTLSDGYLVTGGFFQTLGVQAMLGRLLHVNDDRGDAPPAAVVSELFWRTKLGRDPSAIGSAIAIGDRTYTLVGVVPASFPGLQVRQRPPAFFVPMAHVPAMSRDYSRYRDHTSRSKPIITVVGRLRDDVADKAAAAQMGAIGERLDQDAPLGPRTKRRWTTNAIDRDANREQLAATGRWLLVLPILIVMVACTNLANLVLSRGAARRTEFVVRRALGASQWSLVRDHVVELGAIAVIGAGLAMIFARGAVGAIDRLIQSTAGFLPQYVIDPQLGARSYVFAAGLALLCVVVAGLLPAIALSAQARPSAQGGAAAASPRWHGRARLIVGQVAVSFALLIVAALSVRALWLSADERARTAALNRLAVVSVPFDVRDRDDERIRARVDAILREASQVPGISSAAAMTGTFDDSPFHAAISTALSFDPSGVHDYHSLVVATPGVFTTLGIEMVAGRGFDGRDAAAGPPSIVVSRGLAQSLFGTTQVAGRSVSMQVETIFGKEAAPAATIVGVVEDQYSRRTGTLTHTIYMPLAQRMSTTLSVVARSTTAGADGAVTALLTSIRKIDPDLAVRKAGRGDVIAGADLVIAGFVAQITILLVLVTLLMAMTGLYSVLSSLVAQRRRELGIRIALGADRRRLLALVMRDSIRPVVIGAASGVLLAAIARLFFQPMVNRSFDAGDWLSLGLTVVPLSIAAAVASYLPARRAAAVDPIAALKDT